MIYVIADDFTGAAELAAIGADMGISSTVRSPDQAGNGGELAAFDTNSRSLPKAAAVQQVAELARTIPEDSAAWTFKKVDSALRGHVLAEVAAVCKALHRRRSLLLPENPSLGRVIRDGIYFIGDRPIAETDFANDPQYPLKSSRVLEILGPSHGAGSVVLASIDDPFPSRGIAVAEATTSEEIEQWVSRLEPDVLPAGGAEFFKILLHKRWRGATKRGIVSAETRLLEQNPQKILILSGSASEYSRSFSATCRHHQIPVCPVPRGYEPGKDPQTHLIRWAESALSALSQSRSVRVCIDLPLLKCPSAIAELTGLLRKVVETIATSVSLDLLLIEGGATASDLARRLPWYPLGVEGSLSAGVVLLRPAQGGIPMVISKPGSYPWPTTVLRLLGISSSAF